MSTASFDRIVLADASTSADVLASTLEGDDNAMATESNPSAAAPPVSWLQVFNSS
jgi:hypothetical protein